MTKTKSAAVTILKAIGKGKTGTTAKEIEAKTGLNPKTIRNNLGSLVSKGTVDFAEYLRTCKVSGNTVTAYTNV